jgi:hypothetical protein
MESDRSRLLGDSKNPTQDLQAIAMCLATCRAHVSDAPEWFKQSRGLIEDEDALLELYNKILETCDSWRKDIAEAAKDKSGN